MITSHWKTGEETSRKFLCVANIIETLDRIQHKESSIVLYLQTLFPLPGHIFQEN